MKDLLRQASRRLKTAYGRFLISRNGFWFVDIPRTSSTSIHFELYQRFGIAYGKRNVSEQQFSTPQLFPDHLTAKQMCELLGLSVWDRIFTFTIVRNPWDRTYSLYHWCKKKSRIPPEWSFRDYIFALEKCHTESDFSLSPLGYRTYYGAADYVLGQNGKVIVDYIVKYENRAHDLKAVADRLGLETLGTTHVQTASPQNNRYVQFYDSTTREIVGSIYATDVELFDYTFDG